MVEKCPTVQRYNLYESGLCSCSIYSVRMIFLGRLVERISPYSSSVNTSDGRVKARKAQRQTNTGTPVSAGGGRACDSSGVPYVVGGGNARDRSPRVTSVDRVTTADRQPPLGIPATRRCFH